MTILFPISPGPFKSGQGFRPVLIPDEIRRGRFFAVRGRNSPGLFLINLGLENNPKCGARELTGMPEMRGVSIYRI